MRKLLVILGICVILTCTPILSASQINPFKHRGLIPKISLQSGGTFSGEFAMKNETGFIPLGNISGTYTRGANWTAGTLSGIWAMYDETASGDFNGYIFHRLFIAQYNITDGDSGWFIGLYKLNETTNEFRAISIVFAGENHLIRYAIGTYIENS